MSILLDLIFPRPYDQSGYYRDFSLKPIRHFPVGPLTDSLTLFRYHGTIRQVIMDIKYNFVSDACRSLVSLAVTQLYQSYPNLVQYWQQQHFTLVPVPLHANRHRWRGFNQAQLLGQLLANQLQLSYSSLLIRSRYTPPQVSLHDKLLRSRNLKNVFTVRHSPVTDHILLFDDVATTHSTLRSAAATLHSAGTSQIFALTIAG